MGTMLSDRQGDVRVAVRGVLTTLVAEAPHDGA
jgi:hypothetical protein